MNSITSLFLYVTITAVLLRSSESCKPCVDNLNFSCCKRRVTTIPGSFCKAIIKEDPAKGIIIINAGELISGASSSSSAIINQIKASINALTGFGSNSIYGECLRKNVLEPEPTDGDILEVEHQIATATDDAGFEVAESTGAPSESTPLPSVGCPKWRPAPPPGMFMGTTKCEFLQFHCVEYVKDYNRCLSEYLANIQLVYKNCARAFIEGPGFNPCRRCTRKCIKAGLLQALQSFTNCRLHLNRKVSIPCFPRGVCSTCTWPSTLPIV
eukprot:Plantae.Rhodophyta-Hildenbrandia_rubra.ctg10559.p1 GENE.Plantae.Rhodophyta-Hildenbrandia_rubra.ctg10559~~Plantae.Rhodophyta-Hildenbrandia_rubra.ctg10559.p1  ORF type:complete len:269 (-),score=16.25 Plantae.Rhodophyta-Hildenbrandia_rubra.ctg10559:1311-2117(-)